MSRAKDRRELLTGLSRVTAALLAPSGVAATGAPSSAEGGRTWHVMPQGNLQRPSQAARLARDGDRVVIAPGEYRADVAVWPQTRLTIIAQQPGTVRLIADGAAAEGKAIWVIRGGEIEVSGISFEGTAVPDGNGAGIRFERGDLRVRHCRFEGNEVGVLTNNDEMSTLTVEDSEFAGRLSGPRFGHNLYVGRIARLHARRCWFHTGFLGHLLKSRARVNLLRQCRLVDGPQGRAAYELEFPEGGDVDVEGCEIEQGLKSGNRTMLSYGAEGYRHSVNRLRLVDNRFTNLGSAAVFVRVAPGTHVTMTSRDNRWSGAGRFDGWA